MTAAAWIQAIATLALILVTAWYVYHTWRIAQRTAQAADAARESAQAAKEMVGLERQRMILSQKPEIAVSVMVYDDPLVEFRAKNFGSGCAVKCSGFLRAESHSDASDHEVKLHHTLEPGQDQRVRINLPLGNSRDHKRIIVLCHYEDRYSNPVDPRVYHSLHINPELPHDAGRDAPQVHFTPELPMEDNPEFREYLSLCKACQETQAESHHKTSDV